MQMTSPHNPEATARLAPARDTRPSVLDALGKRAVLAKLAALRDGCLVMVEGNERHRFGKARAVLRRKIDAQRLQIFELGRQTAGVERTVGARNTRTSGTKDGS